VIGLIFSPIVRSKMLLFEVPMAISGSQSIINEIHRPDHKMWMDKGYNEFRENGLPRTTRKYPILKSRDKP